MHDVHVHEKHCWYLDATTSSIIHYVYDYYIKYYAELKSTSVIAVKSVCTQIKSLHISQ